MIGIKNTTYDNVVKEHTVLAAMQERINLWSRQGEAEEDLDWEPCPGEWNHCITLLLLMEVTVRNQYKTFPTKNVL